MEIWQIERQYPDLVIPDTWSNVQDFARWYFENKKPMLVPWDAQVVRIENASSIPLFRKGNFQVEMYLVYAGYDIPKHSHPDMDVVTVILGGGEVCGMPHPGFGTGIETGKMQFNPAGQPHSFEARAGGFAMLSIEHWKQGKPSSAARNWKGPDIGEMHKTLRQAQ